MKQSAVFQNSKIFLIPLFIAITSLLLVYISLLNGWFGPAEGVGNNFCEAARDGLVKQPSNTYSNFAFIIFGVFAAWQLYSGKFNNYVNSLTNSHFFSVFFCSIAVLLGPGSMAMHASEASLGGYFDMLSMYLIAALMFSYATQRIFNFSNIQFLLMFLFVLAVCHYFHFAGFEVPIIGFSGSASFAFFVVTAMIVELVNKLKNKPRISFKWAIACSVSFLTAFLIWTVGWSDHPWCNPDSLLQAHAIWHILCGLAIYFLFRYYVSEDRQIQ
jgi:hypothetical protein